MNSEQKHKEDLEAAKGWLAIAKENNNMIAIQILENLFPELKESEDERIERIMKAHPRKYIVKEDFDYNPSYGDTTDEERTTHFKKGEVYEFELYLGKCHKEGEMSLVTHILPEMNNHFVWKAEFLNEHFRKLTTLDYLTLL